MVFPPSNSVTSMEPFTRSHFEGNSPIVSFFRLSKKMTRSPGMKSILPACCADAPARVPRLRVGMAVERMMCSMMRVVLVDEP